MTRKVTRTRENKTVANFTPEMYFSLAGSLATAPSSTRRSSSHAAVVVDLPGEDGAPAVTNSSGCFLSIDKISRSMYGIGRLATSRLGQGLCGLANSEWARSASQILISICKEIINI